jgi:hypothetical protein
LVVAGGDGAAVDDLLVVGGDLTLALEELRGEVEILGLREHAELPDPGIAMADALAAVSGAASLGAARHALLVAALELVAADGGVLLRDAGHGWLLTSPPLSQRSGAGSAGGTSSRPFGREQACDRDRRSGRGADGDTAFARGTLTDVFASGSRGDHVKSLQRLLALPVRLLLPGHGHVSEDPRGDLTLALEAARETLPRRATSG